MNDARIKIYTRSANIELYHYSQKLIDLPYPRVRLCGTSADGYLYQMVQDVDCDIAINIDEDAYVIDNAALLSLLNYVIANNIVCCGMRDGGALSIRNFNPIIQQPFFNIINIMAVRKKYNQKEIKQFDYNANKEELIKLLPVSLQNYEGLKYTDFEPYYNFFFWMARNFKMMYLDVAKHNDGLTTIVYNQLHEPVLMHTWYSREYNLDAFHTSRIKAVINEAYVKQRKKLPVCLYINIWRWFERKSQQLAVCWNKIRLRKKSPMHYLRKLSAKIPHKQ